MNTTDINTLDLLNSSISPMEYWKEHGDEILRANDLETICGIFSGQAKGAAIIGIVLAVIAMFYFGRYRERIVEHFLKEERGVLILTILDKVILISIAMCFGIIIARLNYAG